LFLGNDAQGACHLKWLMTLFEHLSGLKINYYKSDLIAINLDEHEVAQFAKKMLQDRSLPFQIFRGSSLP
jgi:hypothetical protein